MSPEKQTPDLIKVKKAIAELRGKFNPLLPIMSYIHYFDSFNDLLYEEIPLNEKPETISISTTSETIILARPTLWKEGKPVFLIGRGYPISIVLVPNKERDALVEEKMDSFQLDAWLKSPHVTNLIKPKQRATEFSVILFLSVFASVITSVFITYLVLKGG